MLRPIQMNTAAMMAVMIHRRRPEKFDGPGQPEQREKTDLAQVDAELAEQVRTLPRRAIVEESLANRGGIAETADLEEAIDLANAFAGEHLCLSVRDPWTWLGRVRHAGGVFLGEMNAEAIGDYTAGPSHIMPTGGTARFSSPVNVDDFTKIISVFALGAEDLRTAGPPAVTLARAEGLEAHARAVECRLSALGEATGGPVVADEALTVR